MLRLAERGNGIDVSSKREGLEKEKSVLDRVGGYVRSKVAAVLTMAAVLGGVNEAKADTGTVDDIRFDKSLGAKAPGQVALPDCSVGSFTLENSAYGAGGKIELNSAYHVTISLGNKKINIVDSTNGSVKESHTFSSNIAGTFGVVPLGRGYFLVNSGTESRVFNINDIGTPNFNFSLQPETTYGFPVYLQKHNGVVVGVTVSGAVGEAEFFSYSTGQFDTSHPVSDAGIKAWDGLANAGMLKANGDIIDGITGSAVMPDGNVYFVRENTDGTITQLVNPETDEVVPPTPVINVDPSFSLNQEKMVSGKELVANVTDVPENGSVVLNIDGVEFVMTEFASGRFVKSFSAQELTQFANGEFSKVAMVNVKDGSGKVLASADVNMEIDIVAPKVIEFDIIGCRLESGGSVELCILESESIPSEIRIEYGEILSESYIGVQTIDFDSFNEKSEDERKDYLTDFYSLNEETNKMEFKGDELHKLENDNGVVLRAGDGDLVITSITADEAGNLSEIFYRVVSIRKTDVTEVSCDEDPSQDKCEPVEESCEVNPDQAKCAPVEVSCDEDPSQDKCEVEEPKPPVNPETPGGDEEGGGCAVPGSAPAAPGKAPLALFGIMAALGLRRNKR